MKSNWIKFNEELSENDSEDDLQEKLCRELSHKKRVSYALRIHARFNSVRLIRERAVIRERCKEKE